MQCLIAKIIHSEKNFSDEVLSLYKGYSGNCSNCQMGLQTDHFVWLDISRVHLKSNRTIGERLLASDQKVVWELRLNLHKRKWTFLQFLIWKIIHLEKIFSDGVLSLYTGYSENSSDYLMSLQTDRFADPTFKGSNWSVTEQLVKGC